MARRKRKDYDEIHNYVERIEDVLLSESSWSTSDSDCSGCPHPSKGSTETESDDHLDKLELSTLRSRQFINRKDTKPWRVLNRSRKQESISSISGTLSHLSGIHGTSEQPGFFNQPGGMLQQLSLLTAGAQPWNYHICAVNHKRFAYAATLVIYVYQGVGDGNEWQLYSILANHRRTITCIHWHPSNEDIIASASVDQSVCVWSVSRQCVLQAINICRVPTLLSWCYGIRDILSFTTESGPIQVWHYSNETEPVSFRDEHEYSSNIVTYAWHPSVPKRLIVAHEDGRVTLYREDTTKVKHSSQFEGLKDGESHPSKIKTMVWDYNSPDYLLIAYSEGKLWMVDVSSFKIITKFILPGSSTIASLAWLPNAPGMFITGDSEKGVLRIWSVSKPTPLENCLLKDTGFHCLAIPLASLGTTSSEFRDHEDRGEGGKTVFDDDIRGPTIPKVSVLTLFKDGGIGIYHLRRKEWIFKRDHGHTETIFDCSFKPEDSDLLATGSFDGSIKIWRVDTMEAVETLPNRPHIIYSISWAPADLNCIAAGTSNGEVFIWNVGKQRIIQEFKMHKEKKVFCVAWNLNDSRRIASVGESGYCFVHQVGGPKGVLVQSYKHPGPVYGCDWKDDSFLATGCEDGKIRIFNVNKSGKESMLEIKAHQQKVFRVKWNPVYSDILCSGSDDTSIKIWSFSKAQCLSILVGHSDNVRGLVWCPEIPSLLISGSWDRTMRVWDARSSTCLDIVFDHRADVYGLSIHPLRPFLLASCSRDSTVRLWSLSSLVAPLQLKVLAKRPFEEIIANKYSPDEQRVCFDPSMRLCGLRAEHLQSTVSKCDPGNQELRSLKLFADLFCADVHIRNLWDLVYVLQGNSDISALSLQYASSIVHHSHLFKCTMASATEMEMALGKGKGINKRKIPSVEGYDLLASLYLSVGAMQQYCELMIQLKRWDHALALAPAVSIDYWRQLVQRHADLLLSDDSNGCVPYLLASKDADKLIQFHLTRGHLNKALSSCMAIAKPRPNFRKASMPVPPAVPPRIKQDVLENLPLSDRLIECATRIAEWHLQRGSPITAACSLLAVDNIEGAVQILLRGHEPDLVVVLGQLLIGSTTLNDQNKLKVTKLMDLAKQYLVYRSLKLSAPDIALDLAQTLSDEGGRALLNAEIVLSVTEDWKTKEALYLQAGFPPPAELQGNTYETLYEDILYNLLSTSPDVGVTKAIQVLKDSILNSELDDPIIWKILSLLQAVPLGPAGKGLLNAGADFKAALLSISAFLGAVKATFLGYFSIIIPLLNHAQLLLEKYNPPDFEFLKKEILKAKEKLDGGDSSLGYNFANVSLEWLDVGETHVCGSHLPRHSDNFVCCITHQIIKGPGYFLEDDTSVLGLNDALMWAKVHPFSPLGTGHRLNPF